VRRIRYDFNLFRFYQEHEKIKALMSIMFNKGNVNTKDVRDARQIYTDKLTLVDSDDHDTLRHLKKSNKKHYYMYSFMSEDEVDTVGIMNDGANNPGNVDIL
jgi:hypothetical protein